MFVCQECSERFATDSAAIKHEEDSLWTHYTLWVPPKNRVIVSK